METTIVVSLTLKVNASGDTPDELLSNATLNALAVADRHFGVGWDDGVPGISVEGATALVNREALEASFNRVETTLGEIQPTTACTRYGCWPNRDIGDCNRCGA